MILYIIVGVIGILAATIRGYDRAVSKLGLSDAPETYRTNFGPKVLKVAWLSLYFLVGFLVVKESGNYTAALLVIIGIEALSLLFRSYFKRKWFIAE